MRVLLLLLVLSAIQSVASLEFYVSQGQSGNCERTCLERNPHSQTIACCSVEQVAKKYGTNTSDLTVHLFGNIKIMELVMFKNVSSLTISGDLVSKPVLSCGMYSYNTACGSPVFWGANSRNLQCENI